jgi:hypothetical protein
MTSEEAGSSDKPEGSSMQRSSGSENVDDRVSKIGSEESGQFSDNQADPPIEFDLHFNPTDNGTQDLDDRGALQAEVVESAVDVQLDEEDVQFDHESRPLSPPGPTDSLVQERDDVLSSPVEGVAFTEQRESHHDSSSMDVEEQQGGTVDAAQSYQYEASGPLDPTASLRNVFRQEKTKTRHYSYPTDADADTIPNEIDEFYSYVEAPQVVENHAAWVKWCQTNDESGHGNASSSSAPVAERSQGRYTGALGLGIGEAATDVEKSGHVAEENSEEYEKASSEWTSLPTSARRKHIETLLTLLEVKDPDARQGASRALLYLLQGSFADTHGPEHQLSWIMENARMVRMSGGLGEIYSAFKIASWKHDWLSSLPDHIPSSDAAKEGEPAPEPLLTWQTKLEYLDEINLELALHFAQLYILIETQRGEEEWGDDLMSLEPPLPIYLFGLVASLREKSAKGYPVKKLLLLLWKSLLATFGGIKDVARCKERVRDLEGLQPKPRRKGRRENDLATKASPLDLQAFQDEVAVKYPTYAPSRRRDDLPFDKIASAVAPLPIRKPNGTQNEANGGNGGMNLMPGTPAPSPPPTPKANKQKYQTDQTRPFVFPYSTSVQGPRTVPFSIEEASQLYRDNMYVSLELWQLWRMREELIHDESGVANAADGSRIGFGGWEKELRKIEMTMNGSRARDARSPSSSGSHDTFGKQQSGATQSRARGEATLDRLEVLEKEVNLELARVEGDHMLAVVDNDGYLARVEELRQKRADVRRLQRVDVLYRAVLPHLQSSIIVLLKLLLATVTQQNSTNSPYFQALAEGLIVPPPTLEDIDIVRHREITSKAISGILLLLLKWFKVSHVMKFNFLSQLLVDSNCLLLILKMFGLTEVNHQVRTVNEIPNFNFFRFCELNCGQEPRKPRPEDTVLAKQPFDDAPSPPMGLTHLNSVIDEVEYMDRYSFRNFFASLSFTRVLQKLTKRKIHRILLLVQYKSSAILKRTLKVPHPSLQLYALKVIKSQVPFCGRKWRQANMKVITAIYLNCRPDLRDEWLSGSDVDGDVEGSLPQEQALRGLVKYYNQTRIGSHSAAGTAGGLGSGGQGGHAHKRSASASLGSGQFAEALPGGGEGGAPLPTGNALMNSASPHANPTQVPTSPTTAMRATANFFESDHLPPLRRSSETTAGTRRYIPDDLLEGYLDDYEDILGEVFGDANASTATGPSHGLSTTPDDREASWNGLSAEGSQVAWARLGEILGEHDSISDSESIHSLASYERGQEGFNQDGDMAPRSPSGTRAALQNNEEEELEEGAQTWESLSPQAMRYLTSPRPSTPGSPHHLRRRSSGLSGGGLVESSGDAASAGLGFRKGSDSSPLRPVLSFGPEILNDPSNEDDQSALTLMDDQEEDQTDDGQDEQLMPRPKAGGIDEVEHIWNV